MQSKPITFETFAPRNLKRVRGIVTAQSLTALWTNEGQPSGKIDHSKLKDAIGVYVIGSQNGSTLTPWYVGKTDKGFRRRFEQHLRQRMPFEAIYRNVPDDDLFVILIARTTSAGKLKLGRKPEALTKTKALRSIDFLESDLIRACHAKNRALINTSNRVFHDGFSVPGFLGPRADEELAGAEGVRHLLH